MVSTQELKARLKSHFRFTNQEIIGLVAATLFFGFIFSFRDWGDATFNLGTGLLHLFLMFIIVGFSLFVRYSLQKMYALGQGFLVTFKLWWTGLFTSLAVCFVSLGYVPLAFVGGFDTAFISKLRLHEFRYGFSYEQNGMIGFWGIIANLLLAILFAVGWHIFPQSYFFKSGVIFNIIMGFCHLVPMPQLDGLTIFFGGRARYVMAVLMMGVAAILLLTQTTIGLIIAIVLAALIGAGYASIGSET